MPDAYPFPHQAALEAEIQQLRAENQRLRADREVQAEHAAQAKRYQQSQERFRTVFDNSPLGLTIIGPDLVIRQANQEVATMLGLASPEALVGRGIIEFAHPHHRYDWNLLQERLWKHKTPSFSLETCLMRPDGSSFWCQVHSVLFSNESGEMGHTTLEDISERKDLEFSLKRLYDAQETILHLVAHDLKNPINNIQMLAELVRRDANLLATCPDDAQHETGKLLDLILRSCGEANTLLKDILYLGELDATRLNKQQTDLRAFLENRLGVCRLTAQERGIDLTLELPAEPLHENLNADRFARVIDNLLTNALKFTPSGGRICVGLAAHAGRTRLTVQDTGMGIPAELQAHIFDKFSTAVRTGLHGDGSTGLGLFIAKQIVRLHGGKIWVESQEHEGTTFFVELA